MLPAATTRNSRQLLQALAEPRTRLLLVAAVFALLILVVPTAVQPNSYELKIGEVASQDITAPYALTYQSAVLTEQAKKEAESSVLPVYLPADPTIARRQLERLRITLAYINNVRMDAYASHWQQISDLQAVADIEIDADLGEQILSMPEDRWAAVQQETLRVLEQAMRNTIRENRVDEVYRSLPSMVSFSLQEEQSDLVIALVRAYLVPNSLYSPEQTEEARQQISGSIEPVSRSFVPGETIVNRGQIINQDDWEALEKYGLVEPRDYLKYISGASALVILLAGFTALYMHRRIEPRSDSLRSLALIAALLLVFLLGARLIIPNRTVIPYVYPIPAFGLTIAVLFSSEYGLIFSLSSFCGVLVLGRARRVANFFWAGLAVGLAGAAVVAAFRLPDSNTDWIGIATLIGAAFFNGMASASLALLFQFLFAQALGLTTALQLFEISRPDHPLLQFLLRRAPGTYQHSLQVANLAEQAAEAIGADALLTRVGALYHDAGKALNSQFFIENQVPGELNPHDDLDPITSATTIIRHVADGLALAQKHQLPPSIKAFISEHHGTMLTRYQYSKALEAAGERRDEVDPEQFRYPGPSPRSRETALLMLADGVEARARAELPKDEAELRTLIKRVFDYCQKEGQLDHTRLTLLDLNAAAESFYKTLRGSYHRRITYPEINPPSEPVRSLPAAEDAALKPPASDPSTPAQPTL